MNTSHRPARRRWPAHAWIGLLVLGCGGDGPDRCYPVAGKVTYKGIPVPSGTISFHPSDPAGRVAAGTIVEGSYRLTTLIAGDGAIAGTYQVAVVSKEVDRTPVHAATRGGSMYDRIAAANGAAKDRIPARYQRPWTSRLMGEVERRSNRLDFDLTD